MKKVLYILGEFEDGDIEWLLRAGRKVLMPAGARLITEGEPTSALFFVVAGFFVVTAGEGEGSTIARVGTGEVLGEISFVDGHPPTATVSAETDSTVLEVPRSALVEKLATDLGFAARFYRAVSAFLADRLRGMVAVAGGGHPGAEELDLDSLHTMSKAGIHFKRILKRLQEV